MEAMHIHCILHAHMQCPLHNDNDCIITTAGHSAHKKAKDTCTCVLYVPICVLIEILLGLSCILVD